jgi:hypothetical protein
METSATGQQRDSSDWRNKVMVAVVLISVVPLVIELAVTWDTLVSHLIPANWVSLVGFHAAVLGGLVSIYAKVSKGVLPERREILLVSTVMLIAWAFDLYIVQKIAGH